MATVQNNNNAASSKRSERKAHDLNEDNFVTYNFGGYVKEHHDKPLYGVEFCHHLKPTEPVIFATVGGSNVTFYECEQERIVLLQCYSDPSPTEIFYTCCWSYDSNSFDVLLAAAGFHGVIRIIYPTKPDCSNFLSGHTGAINDLKFHPKIPSILLSASDDLSLRLWNIQLNICIGVFGGVKGHTGQIVSIDFDSMGERIISGGVDRLILIWRLDKTPVKEAIEVSCTFAAKRDELGDERHSFCTFSVHFPDFCTRDVHSDIVDCVKFFNNLILSKSKTNSIICWKPGSLTETSLQTKSITRIREFQIDNCDNYWYIKFSMDISRKYMALGNQIGNIFLWSLQSDDDPSKFVVLKHLKCNITVRHISFSRDSKILVCVCEDSTVWRWNLS